jgi:phosphate transport system substrate-binding protein
LRAGKRALVHLLWTSTESLSSSIPQIQLRRLLLSSLADIFSGAIFDWSLVGGRPGFITIYARDDKSGTYDFFDEAVLKAQGKSLVGGTNRFEDSQTLSDSVARDPTGIGFIGLNYIGSNKVVGLCDTDVQPRKPSLLTIKTEDYMLSRRLFLYTAVAPTNPNVKPFIEFALGSAAQPAVERADLVNMDLTPVPSDPNDPRNQSASWSQLAVGATEIPTRFRFRSGSSALDPRANRDIGRIVGILSQPQYRGKHVILIGFADSSGSPLTNKTLSQTRADIVRKELALEGLGFSEVVGLGAQAFIASNATTEGREKTDVSKFG